MHIPWATFLVLAGATILLGVKPRISLVLSGLLFISLSFGLMTVAENEGIAFLGVHLALTCGALCLAEHSRLALWKD